jgi:RHS repeat-associated protein
VTRDPFNNVTRTEYDAQGRKRLSIDPDMGEWSYTYNGFGELESQIDAIGQETSMTYDELGRMRSKTDVSGTASWLYDAAPGAGIGKLAAMIGPPDTRLTNPCVIPYFAPSGALRVGRWFEYDTFGNVLEAFECADGTKFQTSYSYDAVGRQQVIRYPEVNGERLAVEYHYTAKGFLHYLTNATDHSLYWAATSVDARGQVTSEYTRSGVETLSTRNPATGWLTASSSIAHGDLDRLIQDWNYEYDVAGNLRRRSRTDAVNGPGSVETFDYDRLDRLTGSHIDVGGTYQATESYQYDTLGNLTKKGDKEYRYGTCARGPHAVCEVIGSSLFDYDANGNMVAGNDRVIEYDAANKVTRIESNPPASAGNDASVVKFIYGADGQRVVQSLEDTDGHSLARTVYVGMGTTGKSLYERTTREGEVEHVQFIYAGNAHGGRAVALRLTRQFGESSTPATIKYYHYDHLGSVTAISDERGRVVDAVWGGADADVMGYDAWGARRNPNGTSASPASFNQQSGSREFTGHETIPSVGLVNMNGRVYDPLLGRFLSPDPLVQFAGNLQSYNRYSYVLNNPLSFTDPTGYFIAPWFDSVVNFGLAVGAIVVCTGPQAFACGIGFALAAFAYNTTSAIYAGVPWGQAVGVGVMGLTVGMMSGGTAGVFGGGPIAQLIAGGASGAVMGAMNSMLSGQDLGPSLLRGAAMGAFGAAVSMNLRMAIPLSQASSAAYFRNPAREAYAMRDKVRADSLANGEVTRRQVGRVPVVIFGGTESERLDAYVAAKSVLEGSPGYRSPHGATMEQALANRPAWQSPGVKPLEIILVRGSPIGSFTQVGVNWIVIAPSSPQCIGCVGGSYPSQLGGGVFTYERLIAHELGHAAMGTSDNLANEMHNVVLHENRVMLELGDTNLRMDYRIR